MQVYLVRKISHYLDPYHEVFLLHTFRLLPANVNPSLLAHVILNIGDFYDFIQHKEILLRNKTLLSMVLNRNLDGRFFDFCLEHNCTVTLETIKLSVMFHHLDVYKKLTERFNNSSFLDNIILHKRFDILEYCLNNNKIKKVPYENLIKVIEIEISAKLFQQLLSLCSELKEKHPYISNTLEQLVMQSIIRHNRGDLIDFFTDYKNTLFNNEIVSFLSSKIDDVHFYKFYNLTTNVNIYFIYIAIKNKRYELAEFMISSTDMISEYYKRLISEDSIGASLLEKYERRQK